ncbi:MAG TPA: class I SAM-dependent methyltransferase [Streptosporangiaceae bacterium]|nr:class I SAM-dependent methyltransferase [Streptosporangiaceae bacterium]
MPGAHEAYCSLAGEYDRLLGDLAGSTWRSGILAELARLRRPGRGGVVVDLGAGTGIGGRLIRQAGWGYRLVGIDRSARMLKSAAGYDARIVADMTVPPAGASSADFMVAGFDTLNYLSPARMRRCLASAARGLKPGGWMIFDYSSPELLRRRWRDYRYDQPLRDGLLRWRNRYDATAARCVSDIRRYDAQGNLAWRETHIQYALDTYPLHQAALAAGLHTERVRDLERPEFSPSASTHVWVLRKETAG